MTFNKQVACGPAIATWATSAFETNALTIAYTCRNTNIYFTWAALNA
jgi:hypothetical protein